MRPILIATLASLALGLPMLAAPAQAQTEDTTAQAMPAHHHHARHRHHRRHHHHSMMHNQAAEGMSGRPDLSGSAGTGTNRVDPTGAQTSLPGAVSNQTPNATAR